jgi:hypothetical protein
MMECQPSRQRRRLPKVTLSFLSPRSMMKKITHWINVLFATGALSDIVKRLSSVVKEKSAIAAIPTVRTSLDPHCNTDTCICLLAEGAHASLAPLFSVCCALLCCVLCPLVCFLLLRCCSGSQVASDTT